MNFIDKTINFVQAGKGGDGIVAFRREKYVPYGGPYGGSGGNGGSVIFIGDSGLNTLLTLQYQKKIRASNGSNGQNKNKNGAKASDHVIKVPLGTLVYNNENNELIGEIINHGEHLVIARGGKGGRGNYSLANAKNRAPNFAEKGDLGESLTIRVELKILADVGMIGFPNVGKSSLISTISNSKSRVDIYPFTTLKPFLGRVFFKEKSFTIADIPGLIKDSHLGKGMGIRFLKHIERCKVLLFVLSAESKNVYKDYCDLIIELKKYNNIILNKPQIIALNKMDLPESHKKIPLKIKIIPISVLKKQNLDLLLNQIDQCLTKDVKIIQNIKKDSIKVFTLNNQENNKNKKNVFEILKNNQGVFVVNSEIIEKWFYRTDFNNDESVKRFCFFLKKIGLEEALIKKGMTNKDKVKICNLIFELLF
ncbi:GTPase ObgE ['Cynodon dactylon' phytoplasma]|uniref:GTPase ObgE n=1 Tax='Cynodon dactylon' phytoplasma TaxID=295320 RepID=UPI00186ABFC3|nr:GTPase ObgE ['Cynodon dactylon' phytoplasma]